jgi:hypothetical protein
LLAAVLTQETLRPFGIWVRLDVLEPRRAVEVFMACELETDETGRVTAIVCTRGRRRPKPCRWCKNPGTRLCDYKVGGKTCDAPLCGDHAKSLQGGLDHCPDHARRI